MWPFEREYMQLALVAVVVVGACSPLIGTFLVQKHQSLMGDGIGHVAFAGVAAGALADVWPVWTALAAAVAGALAVEWLRARGGISGDLALAVSFYGGIAAGAVLLGAADALDAGVNAYLFGQLLTVDRGEALVIVALGALIVATIALTSRALFAMAVDEEWARVAGVPVTALNAALAVLVAVTVVAAMRVVGILLVAALMVLPVASGQLLARSQSGILGWSVAIGVASGVAGLVAARQWGLQPGGTIVLVALGVYAAVLAGRAARRAPVAPPIGPGGALPG